MREIIFLPANYFMGHFEGTKTFSTPKLSRAQIGLTHISSFLVRVKGEQIGLTHVSALLVRVIGVQIGLTHISALLVRVIGARIGLIHITPSFSG